VGALGGRVADATPEVPAWRQVAAALRTVRDADNRPQAVSLELAPASLGRVRIEATLRDGVLDVKLRTETDNALDVLRAGMAELRRDVEAAGVKSGRLEVRALERSSGDHTGDALHERQPGSPGLYADVEPGAGGERGSGRWRSGGDGTSPGLAGTGPLPLPAAVAAGSAATRGLSHHRLDLRL
jgi:hypothetical protein